MMPKINLIQNNSKRCLIYALVVKHVGVSAQVMLIWQQARQNFYINIKKHTEYLEAQNYLHKVANTPPLLPKYQSLQMPYTPIKPPLELSKK